VVRLCEPWVLVHARFHRDRSLSRRGDEQHGIETLADGVGTSEAVDTRSGKDRGIDLA
jgi:hypothetical protein